MNLCYMLDPLGANSMKSANPHSGFHRISAFPCLDTSTQSPTRNQGGALSCNLHPHRAHQGERKGVHE